MIMASFTWELKNDNNAEQSSESKKTADV
jgi:hypothetical protein